MDNGMGHGWGERFRFALCHPPPVPPPEDEDVSAGKYIRNRFDSGLHKSFRWVRVGERLLPGDEARDYVYGDWGRTGRAGQRNFTSKAYRRRISK
jgi:hypothetical protein